MPHYAVGRIGFHGMAGVVKRAEMGEVIDMGPSQVYSVFERIFAVWRSRYVCWCCWVVPRSRPETLKAVAVPLKLAADRRCQDDLAQVHLAHHCHCAASALLT